MPLLSPPTTTLCTTSRSAVARRITRGLRAVLTALGLVTFAARAAESLPDLGEASEAIISPAQERRLGEGIMRDVRDHPAYFDDLEVVVYLNSVGYKLAYQSQDLRFPFEFFGVQDPSVNAFALPGGFIGVHTGLIVTSQSESELAAVLGHEVAHVSQRHLARIIAMQQKSQLASMAALALAILAARSSPDLAQAAVAGAQYASLQTALNFTREHEREADRIGVQLLQKAGFDPRAMPVFFDRLQRVTRIQDTNAPSYARTHPITYERIADVQNRVDALPYRQVPDSEDYLLVRTKLQVAQLGGPEAVSVYSSQLRDKRYNSEAAARYGLVAALLQAKQTRKAAQELPAMLKATAHHAMADALATRVRLAAEGAKAALASCDEALRRHPRAVALAVDCARLQLDHRQPQQALKLVSGMLAAGRNDVQLYELQARAYAETDRTLLKHRSQAEAYVLRGKLAAAIEQLELGLRSGDRDFYEMSSAESRLKELKLLDAESKRK